MLVSQEGRRPPLRPEQLASATGVSEFAWSPDGRLLAYVGGASGGFDIWTISNTGRDPRRVTSSLRFKKQLRWSKDGKWIAFVTVQDDGNSDLRAVTADGQSVLTLTETAADEGEHDWCPATSRMYFVQW